MEIKVLDTNKITPSLDDWLKTAKSSSRATKEGMYLIHNGIVRETTKKSVRQGIKDGITVKGMEFSYDEKKVNNAIEKTKLMPGITHVRVWLNKGNLKVGDDIMYILIGGDIRPHVIDALQKLVEIIKTECVTEIEQYS